VTWSASFGNWSVANNWGGNLPGAADEAYIINGGTAAITTGGAVCNDLYLGDSNSTNSGTVRMSGSSSLSAANSEYLGNYGAGAFTQSGGTNNVGGSLFLGSYSAVSSGSGSYVLIGAGALAANQEFVGNNGTGTFSQSGGTNSAGSLYIATSGSYALSGAGLLSAGYGETVGNSGFGTFNQSGGTNAAGSLTLSGGTYNLNGGVLAVSGIGGTGNFNFSGGTLLLGSSNVSISQDMLLTGGSGNVNTGGNAAIISGNLSGVGGLNVLGNGYLTLAGSNTYTGGTSISGTTTLTLNSPSAAQNSTVNVSANSTLAFDTSSGAIANFSVGGLAGGGNLSLTDYNNYPVAVTIGGNGASTTYSGAIGGDGSLTVTGSGSLDLCGSNTYLGTTTVTAGKLKLDFSQAAAPSSNILNSGSSLVLGGSGGGVLTIQGAARATNSQQFYSLTLNPGCSSIVLTAASSNALLLNLGDISRSPGSTINFTLPSGTQSATNGITTTTPNTDGILGGFATVTATNGTNWACLSGTAGNITAYTGYTNGNLGSLASNASQNVSPTGTQSAIQTADTFNTLALGSTGASQVTMSGAGSLTLLGGGLINNNPNGSIVNGALTGSSGTAGGGELVVITQANLTISSAVTDNGGPTALTKAGTAMLTLTGANTFSGETVVGAGTLQVGNGGSNALLSSPGVTLFDGASLVFNHSNSLTYDGTIGGPGNLAKAGAGELTLTGSNAYTGGTTVSAGTLQIGNGGNGEFLGSSTVALNTSSVALVFNESDSQTYSGPISGAGNVVQTGSGVLTLLGSNTYSGSTTISAGTLQVGNGSVGASLGTGPLTDNGTLVLNLPGAPTFGGAISGNGSLVQAGTGVLTFLGKSTFGGGTTISSGTLQVGNGTAAAALGSGAVLDNSALVFDLPGASTFSGAISGSGSLTQAGTGVLALLGNNTFNGGTTISSGTLQVGNGAAGGALGASSGTVTDNSVLVFDLSGSVTFSGAISGSGSLAQAGNGLLTLTNSNTYTGGTTVSAGTLQVGNGGSGEFLGSPVVSLSNNTTLIFNESDLPTYGGVIQGSGSLVQTGSGMLTLTGSNTYNGGTTISAGTLQLGNGTIAGTLGTGKLVDNGTLLFNLPGASTFAGVISGSGSLVQGGASVLTVLRSNNTYSGGTTISSGTLQLGNGSIAGTLGPGAVTDNGILIFDLPGLATFGGAVNGGGGLTQAGTGVLTLLGSNTYSGNTTISSGTLQLGNGGTTGILAGGGAVEIEGTLVLNRSNNVIMNNPLTGQGSLLKVNSDAVTLTGDMSGFSGPIGVASGQLVLDSAAAASQFTVSSGGTLQFNGASVNLGAAYANVYALSGGVVQYTNANISGGYLWGPGTHVLMAATANSFNNVTINSGAVVQQNGPAVFTNVSNSGQIDGSGGLVLSGGQNAGGTINLSGANDVSAWANNGGMVTIQSGGLLNNHLSNLTSFGGGVITIDSGGTLNADSAGEGVSLDLRDSLLINSGSVIGTINAGNLATVSGSGTFGPINLFNGGMLVVSATASPQTWGTTVNGGEIVGNGVFTAPVTVVANPADTLATLIVRPDPNLTLTLANSLSGAAQLTETGSGTLILSGSNSYSGGTDIEVGTLVATNSNALPGGTSLIVAAGATFIFDPSVTSVPLADPAASRVAAVPEPGTLVLLLAAGAAFAAIVVRRQRK